MAQSKNTSATLKHWSKFISFLKDKNSSYNYTQVLIQALLTFLEINNVVLPPLTFIKRQKKSTYKQTEQSYKRKVKKEELVDFILRQFPKIYTADLTEYSKDVFLRERGRFLVIHMFFSGLRRSEALNTLVGDEKNENGVRSILVRSSKGKEIFYRIIPEDRYWKAREEYLKHLAVYNPQSYLFPNAYGRSGTDGTSGRLTNTRASQIISGYRDNHGNWKKGISEYVWDKKMFTHIFRHARTNDLLKYLSVDLVKEWRNDKSMGTTQTYIDEKQQEARIANGLKDKPSTDWEKVIPIKPTPKPTSTLTEDKDGKKKNTK